MPSLTASPIVGRWMPPLVLASLLFGAMPERVLADEPPAQDTNRGSILAAERDKKAAEISAPERGVVERALYWYDNQYLLSKIFGGWNGLRLAGGDFPAGAGTKFGVGYSRGASALASTNPTRSNRPGFDTVAAYSTRGYTRAGAAFSLERIGGAGLDLRVRGQYYKFPQEDFFGIGADSSEENRTNYLLENSEAGAELQWKPWKHIELSGGMTYLRPKLGSGTDSRFQSTELVFDPATTPGLAAQPDFLRSDAGAAFDWRDNPLHPHAGGRYGVELSDFRDQDLSAYSFRRVAIDLQQYVPVPNRYRTIALHAAAVMTDPRAGNDVPFFYQPTLGGSRQLRGFREFRFQDRNSLSLTAEYRWEASWMLDGALFVDAGKVAADRSDLTFRDLEVSYGIGFRVHSNSAFTARLDLAFSREGFIPLLRFEHVF
jgi:hypothetical protein